MPSLRPRVRTSPETWGEMLRVRHLRITAGRIATLTHLEAHPHSSVAEIHAALNPAHPSLSLQSIHNIAQDLTACGLLRRVDLPDSDSARYETHTHDNHHHVQCIVCQRIEDTDCVFETAPCLTPTNTHGMRIVEAAITFRGICAQCDAAAATQPAAHAAAAGTGS